MLKSFSIVLLIFGGLLLQTVVNVDRDRDRDRDRDVTVGPVSGLPCCLLL